MRSFRSKFLIVIALCLLPMAVATFVFYLATQKEMVRDAETQMVNARAAFTLEFDDDLLPLQVAARWLTTDPDVVRELAAGDGATLYEHLDDFDNQYRVYLTDTAGTILASSHTRTPHGSLAAMPEIQGALAGQGFAGITQVTLKDASLAYVYALVRPVTRDGKIIGALFAAFALDEAYFDDTAKKQGVAISFRVDDRIIAETTGYPVHDEHLHGEGIDLRTLSDGRALAVTSFTPQTLGDAQGTVQVTIAKDVTQQLHDSKKYLLYRLLVLACIAAMALTSGLLIANPMVRAVAAITRVLPSVASKKYLLADSVHTGDELQTLAETYNAMIGQLELGERQREALGKYLSRAARDAAEHGQLALGGTTMSATVLFSDIRGFTTLSEKMEPEHVLSLLNRYFTEMVGAVVRHRGIVDKFIGDCIMAVWGPPHSQKDDAMNAIYAALEMRERLAALNKILAEEGIAELRTGIGIHTGAVVAGNMGAEATKELEGKMEYTVIGDTVNLASRLESLTKELHVDVLLSEDTYRLVAANIEAEALPPIKVRGREKEVGVYRLLGLVRK